MRCPALLGDVPPGERAGQPDVREENVGQSFTAVLQAFLGGFGFDDLKALVLKHIQEGPDQRDRLQRPELS